jgi:hypothetical protein
LAAFDVAAALGDYTPDLHKAALSNEQLFSEKFQIINSCPEHSGRRVQSLIFNQNAPYLSQAFSTPEAANQKSKGRNTKCYQLAPTRLHAINPAL